MRYTKIEALFRPGISNDLAEMYMTADDNFKKRVIKLILDKKMRICDGGLISTVVDENNKKVYNKTVNGSSKKKEYTIQDTEKGKEKGAWGEPKTVGEDYFKPKK